MIGMAILLARTEKATLGCIENPEVEFRCCLWAQFETLGDGVRRTYEAPPARQENLGEGGFFSQESLPIFPFSADPQ